MFGHDENTKTSSDGSFGSVDPAKDDDSTSPAFISSSPPPDDDEPAESKVSSAPSVSPNTPTSSASNTNEGHDLLDIKQSALQQLTPLVGHLDQTPEEKFRTTMMMIQASDNQALVKEAYEAAQAITDEKVKAQALLDIVNEINYFTQHS